MAKARYRPPVPGPSFIRLLAGFADGPLPATSPDLSDRLSQWVDWNRAVALSRALDGRVADQADAAPGATADEQAECARVRAALIDSIAAPALVRRGEAADDFGPHRQRYLTLQRSMQAATGRLRGRLRDQLSLQAPALARLAEVDAVMEQTLSPREQSLLATVPVLLGQHFERLRAAELPPVADADSDTAPPGPTSWHARFQQDMQAALMAELDVRFHPIDGLLAALAPR